MRARTAVVLLLAAAAFTWWISQPRAGPQAKRRPQAATSSTGATTAGTSITGGHAHGPAGEAKAGHAEIESYRRELADPAHSDLPPALFAQLTQLGVRVQRAYLTSVGRDEFPGYFGRDTVPALYSQVHIESAGARSRNSRADAVDVIVVWSGRPANGGPTVVHHMTVVLLVNRDGDWQPQAQFG